MLLHGVEYGVHRWAATAGKDNRVNEVSSSEALLVAALGGRDDLHHLQGGGYNDHALRQRTVLDPTYIKPK